MLYISNVNPHIQISNDCISSKFCETHNDETMVHAEGSSLKLHFSSLSSPSDNSSTLRCLGTPCDNSAITTNHSINKESACARLPMKRSRLTKSVSWAAGLEDLGLETSSRDRHTGNAIKQESGLLGLGMGLMPKIDLSKLKDDEELLETMELQPRYNPLKYRAISFNFGHMNESEILTRVREPLKSDDDSGDITSETNSSEVPKTKTKRVRGSFQSKSFCVPNSSASSFCTSFISKSNQPRSVTDSESDRESLESESRRSEAKSSNQKGLKTSRKSRAPTSDHDAYSSDESTCSYSTSERSISSASGSFFSHSSSFRSSVGSDYGHFHNVSEDFNFPSYDTKKLNISSYQNSSDFSPSNHDIADAVDRFCSRIQEKPEGSQTLFQTLFDCN